MLDGAARLGKLFERTAEMGMPALAMTDHGNVFGAHDFYRQARAAGVNPIIGMEAYLTPNTSRFERTRVRWADGGDDDVSGAGAYTHMTLLSESTQGMHNLFRLASRSSLEGFFYKPRADRELLAEYADGLIAHHRLPVRRGADLAADRRLREGTGQRGRVPGHLRHGELLPRADGPRPGHRDQGPRRAAAAGQGPAAADGRHQRPALHRRGRRRRARGAAVRAVRQDPGRPQPVQVRRPRLLPEVARRDARAVGRQVPAARRPATTPC